MGLLVLSLYILAYPQMILQAVLITQIMLCIKKYSIILVEEREEDWVFFVCLLGGLVSFALVWEK